MDKLKQDDKTFVKGNKR